MTDHSERLTVSLNDPGPTREKRAYNRARPPVRQEEVRADPVRSEPVRTKRVRLRKNQSTTGPLEIPLDVREIVLQNHGMDLMWATNSLSGDTNHQTRQRYHINCWDPVTGDMFDGLFDGMFMPKGYKGEIVVGASVLLYRPYELTLEARGEERSAANQARGVQERQIRTGHVDGVNPDMFDPSHSSARANTRLTSSRQPYIPVPRE